MTTTDSATRGVENGQSVFYDDPVSTTELSAGGSSSDGDDKRFEKSSKIGSARTPWYGTALIVLAEVMGTGLLSLPYAAVTLGWVTAVASAFVFAAVAICSGSLLSQVITEHPEVKSFADAARTLIGSRFALFTRACMIVFWAALTIYYLIATADSIGSIYNHGFFACSINRTLVAAVILLVLTQVRDFHSIAGWMSLPSTLAILGCILIITISLCLQEDASFGKHTTVGPVEGTSSFSFLRSLSAFVFAYQGQSIFFELMGEMASPKKFPLALLVSYGIMFSVYTYVVTVAYGYQGNAVPGFLPNGLEEN